MSRLFVIILGLVLVLGGSASIWQGYDIIQVERGWTEVIAGATALTGGVVTIAVGLLIGVVARLRHDILATLAAPAFAPPGGPAPLADVPEEVAAELDIPRPDEIMARVAEPPEDHAPPPPLAPHGARSLTPARLFPAAPALEETSFAQAKARIDEALADEPAAGVAEDDPIAALDALAGQPRASATPASRASTSVVGRYTFGGSNYALFDDGSIEAETPDGVKRFASLADLRKHIDIEGRNSP